MDLKKRAGGIVEILKREYPASCSLDVTVPHELLISARLAAQCTDERVNVVGQTLYDRYRSINDFANADIEELENIIRPCGLYHTKAKSIIDMSKMMMSDFGGKVPDNMDDLLKLPGVGRKIANLIMGDVYKKPAIVTDTHCIRITNLLGLAHSKDPYKVERELTAIIEPQEQSDFCHRIVHHGRAVCIARRPQCDMCCLKEYCDHYAQVSSGQGA